MGNTGCGVKRQVTDDQAPAIPCAACGIELNLHDVVIVSREVVPTWVSPVELSTPSIVHKACELSGGRDDRNWMPEAPQTLSRVLVTLAVERDSHVGRSRAWRRDLDRQEHLASSPP